MKALHIVTVSGFKSFLLLSQTSTYHTIYLRHLASDLTDGNGTVEF